MKLVLLLSMVLAIGVGNASSQQVDTSSYFPLGFWAIWIDGNTAPLNHQPISVDQWGNEIDSWSNINGNYLVAWIPDWVEDTVMSVIEPLGYKMDVARSNYTFNPQTDTSIQWWIQQAPNPLTAYWKQRALDKLNGIKTAFAGRPGFHTIFMGHESQMFNTNLWPAFRFVVNACDSLMPDIRTKPYFVLGANFQIFGGFNLLAFADYIPKLRMFSVDAYFFETNTTQTYQSQQERFGGLVVVMDTTMKILKDRPMEYWFTLQSQRSFGEHNFRRISFLEQRAQAYLGLSRGAKGLNWFLYGSNTDEISGSFDGSSPSGLGIATNTGYNGLVALDRRRWELSHQFDTLVYANTARIDAEILQLAPTVRKLRVYDAFPNTTIPQSNIASITSVSGDKIEIGVFKRVDEGADSTVYFMFVNRVCNLENGNVSDPQSVSVTFTHPTFQSLLITEVVSGEAWVVPSQGTFSTVLDPGSGKLFRMENAVISGARTFPQGLAILGGATLTADQDAQLSFRPGTSLTVAGALIVNGSSGNVVSLSSTTPPNHWSGITVTGACNPTVEIEYAQISHATTALTVTDRAYSTLANSSIENCDIGLQIVPSLANCPQIIPPKYVTNNTFSNVTLGINLSTSAEINILSNMITGSDVGISLSNPTYAIIDGNVVRENSIGISISGCGPVLHSNLIEDNSDYGVWVSDFADPRFGDMVSNDPGHNIIRNNNRPDAAQIAALTGFPFFGCHEEWCGEEMGGYNSIYYDLNKGEFRYAIEAREKSDVLGHIGWWGVYPADPELFVADESSNIDYRFELDYDPNGGNGPFRPGSVAVKLGQELDGGGPSPMLSLTPEQRLLLQALGFRGRQQYTEALALYVQLILTRPLRPEALVAVGQLRNCYRDYIRHSGQPQLHEQLRQYLSSQSSGHSNPRLRTMAKFLLAQECRVAGQPHTAAQIFSDVAAANQNTPMETSALYSLFGVLAFDLGNAEQAADVLNSLENRYPTDPRTQIARIQYNAMSAGGGNATLGRSANITLMQRTTNELPKEFALHQNYPNPFNPTTAIRFFLPEDVRTVLKVYDLLGREVRTLVDEFTKVGDYTVDFDASRLASGMYLYRLQAGPFSQTKKLILLR